MSNTALLGALLEFQKNPPTLVRDGRNEHFSSEYLTLGSLMSSVLPRLNELGLVWITMPGSTGDGGTLIYELIHVETGELLNGVMPLLLDKRNPQGLGSAITYARRQALMSVLGLVADADDDGNAASAAPPTVHPDDARPAAPVIPQDRAKAILTRALELNLAKETGEGTDFKVTLEPVLQAKLAAVGVDTGKIGHLNVDQAEDVEAWLEQEAKGA